MKSDRPKISLQSVPPWLRHLLQRSWLAGVISVGFHGVLFAAGPTFSGLNFRAIAEPELAAAERRTVPLIELSAAEQQRLPDFSSQSLYGFDDLESLGYLSLPPGATTPNSSGSGSIRTPAPPRARSPLQGSDTKVTQSPRPAFPGPSSYGTEIPPLPSSNPQLEIPDELGNGPDTTQDTAAGGVEVPEGTESASNGDAEIAALESDANDLEPQDGNEASAPESLADLIARTDALEELSPEELQQILTYNPARTSDNELDEVLRNWETFEEQVDQGRDTVGGNRIPLDAPIELALPYELQACLSPAPQEGLIGAIVDNGGKLANPPELLKSTGYPWFNRQAVRLAEAHDFSKKGPATYRLRVIVNYDAATCVPLESVTGETDSSELPAEGNTRAPVPSENPEASTAPLPEASVLPSDEENDAAAPNPDASAASETVETDAETATDDAETEAEAPSSETSEASTDEDEG